MGERWVFFNDVLRCKGNLWQPCFVSQLLNDIQVNYLTCIYLSFLQMKNVFSNDIQVDYLTCSRTHSSQARRSFLSRTARTPLSQATACIFSGDTYLQRLRKRKIQRWDKDSHKLLHVFIRVNHICLVVHLLNYHPLHRHLIAKYDLRTQTKRTLGEETFQREIMGGLINGSKYIWSTEDWLSYFQTLQHHWRKTYCGG